MAFTLSDAAPKPGIPLDKELRGYLETNQDAGLSNAQVQQYRQKYGENKLKGEGAVKWYSLLIKQISNAMVLVSSLLRT